MFGFFLVPSSSSDPVSLFFSWQCVALCFFAGKLPFLASVGCVAERIQELRVASIVKEGVVKERVVI